jgi:putative serine protease PepD
MPPAVLPAEGTATVSAMSLDDDADDDVSGIGPPLPPDDRLWRHPSELREHGLAGGSVAPRPAMAYRPVTWTVALVAGLAGAALSTAIIAATGSLSPRVIERDVVEKVAVTPVVSSPMVGGERGVVAVAERLSPAIVRLDVDQPDGTGTGSGVLFRDDGLVLTSAHVVAAATAISVVLTDGRRLEGHLIGFDRVTDVALVDLDGEGFPVAVLGTAEDLEVGATTIAIGSPLGFEGGPSVPTGVISAVNRRVDTPDGEVLHGMIQTDAPIAPGSSGGALVDASGAVIGITTAVADQPAGGFGFATPIDLARRVADQLLRTGHMVHGWLGVEGADLTAQQARAMGVEGGAVVRTVAAGSPAAGIGLAMDDVITEVAGQHIGSVSGLVVQLRAHDPGDQVVVGYWRHGRHAEVTVTLAERP